MKLNISKTFFLLSILLLSYGVASAAPTSSKRSNCCTPINKDSIIAALHPVHASGGVSANYTLRFNPSNPFKNQMQAYINYLHAMNPSITSIITNWRIGDAGTGALPATPGNGGVVAGAGQQFTTWSSGGNGNLSNGPGNFWNGYPLKINHWYNIYTGTYLNDGNEFFSKKCAYNNFYVNFIVLKSSNGNGQLQISDGTRIIKTIPCKNGKEVKVMDKIKTRSTLFNMAKKLGVLNKPKVSQSNLNGAKQKINPSAPAFTCKRDGKQCPDGSVVGRAGSKCEFTKCAQ